MFVCSHLRQIAAGVENDDIEAGEIFRCKDAAIFGAGDVKAVFLAQFSQDFFGVAELVGCRAFNDAVLEAGGFGEVKDLFGFGGVHLVPTAWGGALEGAERQTASDEQNANLRCAKEFHKQVKVNQAMGGLSNEKTQG